MSSFKDIFEAWCRHSVNQRSALQVQTELKEVELRYKAAKFIQNMLSKENKTEPRIESILNVSVTDEYERWYEEKAKNLKAELKALKSTKLQSATKILNELKRSRAVKQVRLYNDNILIKTVPLLFRDVNIGQYVISLGSRGGVRVFNATFGNVVRRAEISQHPHISSNGRVCTGEWDGQWRTVLKDGDIIGLITLILAIIQESEVVGSEHSSEEDFLNVICKASGQPYPLGEPCHVDEDLKDDGASWDIGTVILEK